MAQAGPPATAQPQQPDQPTQAPAPDDHGLLAALVLILGAAVTAQAAEALVAQALAPIGVGAQAAIAAYRLAMATKLPSGAGAVAGPSAAAAKSWRAAYLLAAAKRLARGVQSGNFQQALANERRYALAHRAAQANRLAMAQRIDALVAEHGDTLEWRAHRPIDSRVTPECLAADGHLFSASKPPAIGLPGAVHNRCRCRPIPPTAEARIRGVSVDEAVIAAAASD